MKPDEKDKAKKGSLASIKSGTFSRGFALAKVSLSAGTKAASHAIGGLFSSEDEKADRLKDFLYSQIDLLTKELGQLKGSLMKVGQMLSMYGEHVLPPEANALLKSLQSESAPLEWKAIEKVLRKQLSEEALSQLEIEQEPIGSASMGQVHRARRKSDGRLLAMKIQYPGVDQAIESDLKALRSIFSMAKLIPKGPKFDEVFREVRQMLHYEVDYERERASTEDFRALLKDDPRYIIPETFPEFSTHRVITTSYEEGFAVDSAEVKALPQERRNALGGAFLELYFRELFEFGKVQTDPHFGNYRIRIGKGGEPDRLVLFDFGAVRKFPKTFLTPYFELIRGTYLKDTEMLERGAEGMGFLMPEDTHEQRRSFAQMCFLFTEPFSTRAEEVGVEGVPADLYDSSGAYDWGRSDLPKRAISKGKQLAFALKLRSPPREIVFLDRKMGGIFIFLSVLGVRMRGKELLEKHLPR